MEYQEFKDLIDDLAHEWGEFKDECDKGKEADQAKLRRINDAIDETKDRLAKLETTIRRPGSSTGDKDRDWRESDEGKAFDAYLRKGERVDEFERKALTVADDVSAGYLTHPEFANEITKGITEISPARALARVTSISGKSLIIPKRTGQFSAVRVAEVGTRSETEGLTYAQNEIVAPEMYAQVNISNQMREDSAFNMDTELRGEFAEQFAVLEGSEFVSGNGAEQMEGLLTNSDVGESNSGSASVISDADGGVNGLMTLMYALKSLYRTNGTWLANRTTIGALRQLKDSDKQYLWQPGLQAGQPDRLLGAPVVEVPDMPDIGAGTYPVIFGDFRRAYRVADRVSMSILSDPYTLANVGQHKFLARRRTGGAVVLPEAIRKLKIST